MMSPPATRVHVEPALNGLASPGSRATSGHEAVFVTRSTPNSDLPLHAIARTAGVTWEARRKARREESAARSLASAAAEAAIVKWADDAGRATPRAARTPSASALTSSSRCQCGSVPARTPFTSDASIPVIVERKSTTGTIWTPAIGPVGAEEGAAEGSPLPADGLALAEPSTPEGLPLGEPDAPGSPVARPIGAGEAAGEPPRTASERRANTATRTRTTKAGVGRRRTVRVWCHGGTIEASGAPRHSPGPDPDRGRAHAGRELGWDHRVVRRGENGW